jgi:hypothetical protein
MRRLSDRARLEGMLALRKALEGVRRGHAIAVDAGDQFVRDSFTDRAEPEDPTWLRRAESNRSSARDEGVSALEGDLEVAKALDRIADSIERVAAQLDSYHLERAEHLDAIEFLLREMVIGTVPSTAARSVSLGGVVDRAELDRDRGITIIPDGYPLEVDTAVEVRSRFHDRWISGFSIAEAVDTPGRCRYRLTRRSDGIPLPILFDACDVRPLSNAHERQPAPVTSLRDSQFRS